MHGPAPSPNSRQCEGLFGTRPDVMGEVAGTVVVVVAMEDSMLALRGSTENRLVPAARELTAAAERTPVPVVLLKMVVVNWVCRVVWVTSLRNVSSVSWGRLNEARVRTYEVVVSSSVAVVLLTEERKVVVVLSTLTVVSVSLVVLQVSVAEVSPTLDSMVDATSEIEVDTAVEVAVEGSPDTMTSRAASKAVSSSLTMPLKPSRYDMRPPMWS